MQFQALIMIWSVCCLLYLVSFSTIINKPKAELIKLMPFECGIEPFSLLRMKFEVLYYLIGLLYLILDLELVLLFPLVSSLFTLPPLAFTFVQLFIILLTLGFLFEWLKGALDLLIINGLGTLLGLAMPLQD
jgi:NADH-quinone oxidoreductase subunit A